MKVKNGVVRIAAVCFAYIRGNASDAALPTYNVKVSHNTLSTNLFTLF